MNFDIKWDKKEYSKFMKYLYSLQDIKYKEFHSRIILDDSIIGIRTPTLKKIAKEIFKHDYYGFLKFNQLQIYEDKIIYGLIIGYIKDKDLAIKYLNDFLPYINNWAICDLTCSNMKIFKKHDLFDYVKELIISNNTWQIRVGLVLTLLYYVNDNHIDEIFSLIKKIDNNEYYVEMGIAWLLATIYINYQDQVCLLLESNVLDNFTHNKTIQKIKESYRVSSEGKNRVGKMKRKVTR